MYVDQIKEKNDRSMAAFTKLCVRLEPSTHGRTPAADRREACLSQLVVLSVRCCDSLTHVMHCSVQHSLHPGTLCYPAGTCSSARWFTSTGLWRPRVF
jgi:hypothetical protein